MINIYQKANVLQLFQIMTPLPCRKPFSWQDSGFVHTKADKFENATLSAKTDKMFCVHTTAFFRWYNRFHFTLSMCTPTNNIKPAVFRFLLPNKSTNCFIFVIKFIQTFKKMSGRTKQTSNAKAKTNCFFWSVGKAYLFL